jgi:hypothetical protein
LFYNIKLQSQLIANFPFDTQIGPKVEAQNQDGLALTSVAEPEPHHFGRAGAATRSGSGSGSSSDGSSSKFDDKHE